MIIKVSSLEIIKFSARVSCMSQQAQNIASINDFLAGEIDLCSPPEIFMRISKMLDDPAMNATSIGEVIEQDPSLSARMLKIVNSAFFGFPSTINSVSQALTLLGDREVRLLVMATSVVEKFSSLPNSLLNMEDFWSHNLRTALFAKTLSNYHPKKRQLSSIFMSGLLHDIGRLILYIKAPDLARAAALLVQGTELTISEGETQTFGFNHAEIGGELLKLWKLPESIQYAVAFHHQPESSESHKVEVSLVCLANKLAHANIESEEDLAEIFPPEAPVLSTTDIPYTNDYIHRKRSI